MDTTGCHRCVLPDLTDLWQAEPFIVVVRGFAATYCGRQRLREIPNLRRAAAVSEKTRESELTRRRLA